MITRFAEDDHHTYIYISIKKGIYLPVNSLNTCSQSFYIFALIVVTIPDNA
jgi:hypothetical protein